MGHTGSAPADDGRLPLVDAHIHYSHDAWQMLPPDKAVAVLRQAGLKRAFVSSSSDEGTQKLYRAAPDLIVPVLRPYRRRGETGTWFRDETVPDMLAKLLAANTYAGIGEFHVYGDDATLPVMRRVVELAHRHRIFLHLHGDAKAVDHVFAQDPEARVLWAHSGFDDPEAVRALLTRHRNLWSDLAFRSEQASGGKVDPRWRALFEDFPDRFMVGTDTFTPERWYYVVDHAEWSRGWLADLPPDLARRIAHGNAEALADWALKK
ncbi:MAG: amidohydrolase [Hyphomicrobiales bacterium]|nr:amidohydrolase [Hyphomicrobiales bacterium]